MSVPIESPYATSYNDYITFRSYRRLLFKFWTLCTFEPRLGDLGAMYAVDLRLVGKLVVDFLFVFIELFR